VEINIKFQDTPTFDIQPFLLLDTAEKGKQIMPYFVICFGLVCMLSYKTEAKLQLLCVIFIKKSAFCIKISYRVKKPYGKI